MDPNATLKEMLALAVAIDVSEHLAYEPTIDDARRLAELVMAMDGWLQGGGALPERWKR